MSFKSQQQADNACFFDTDVFGENVLYDDGSGAVTVIGIVDYGSEATAPGSQASIQVQKSEVPNPAYRHTFTINSVVWHVTPPAKGRDFILSQDEDTFLMAIKTATRSGQWRR